MRSAASTCSSVPRTTTHRSGVPAITRGSFLTKTRAPVTWPGLG